MYKLFTLEEATNLIPVVDRHLADLQAAVHDMLELRQQLQSAPPASVTAHNAVQEINFLLASIHGTKADLDRLGVHLNDVEQGVVEFPARLGAEVICFTWERGQDAITHYHHLSGDTSPRPLPQGLDGPEPGDASAGAEA